MFESYARRFEEQMLPLNRRFQGKWSVLGVQLSEEDPVSGTSVVDMTSELLGFVSKKVLHFD